MVLYRIECKDYWDHIDHESTVTVGLTANEITKRFTKRDINFNIKYNGLNVYKYVVYSGAQCINNDEYIIHYDDIIRRDVIDPDILWEEDEVMEDGVYIDIYGIKNGMRLSVKTLSLKDVSYILTSSIMDGLDKICL